MMRKFLIILTFLFFYHLFLTDASAVETKISAKKGAAYTVMHYSQDGSGNWYADSSLYCDYFSDAVGCWDRLKRGIASLGVTWMYDWRLWDSGWQAAQKLGIEYVPMIFSPRYDSVASYGNLARLHPGRYWLIFNEPDFPSGGAFFTIDNAAAVYKSVYDAMMNADPTAKLIVGGILYDDNWWVWARDFRESYKRQFGVYPTVHGWHGHYYHCGDYSANDFRNSITSFRNWIDGWGGGELWITEFGCLNYDYPQIITDNLDWMESYPGVNRYAWFHIGAGSSMWSPTFNSMPDDPNFALTSTGVSYAEYPTNGQLYVTPTPTPSCLDGDKGSLDCDPLGLIDETDLSILLGSWAPFGPVPTPIGGHHSADISPTSGDGKVDSGDLSFLLSNWKTQ
jgi:hypothetical protein